MIDMPGFRYKWAAGNKLWTDIQENEDEYYISLNKALVTHDPVDSEGVWLVLRIGRNFFMIIHRNDAKKYKENIKDEVKQGADIFPAVVREKEEFYLFCWKKGFMKEPVDDMRSWNFVRADKDFFYLYPHVKWDWETENVLKKFIENKKI
jgi:hypothetical protein